MVDFTYEIIDQIKVAANARQIESIIGNLIQRFLDQDYLSIHTKIEHIRSVSSVLRSISTTGIRQKEIENVNYAIRIAEDLLDKEYENLF